MALAFLRGEAIRSTVQRFCLAVEVSAVTKQLDFELESPIYALSDGGIFAGNRLKESSPGFLSRLIGHRVQMRRLGANLFPPNAFREVSLVQGFKPRSFMTKKRRHGKMRRLCFHMMI